MTLSWPVHHNGVDDMSTFNFHRLEIQFNPGCSSIGMGMNCHGGDVIFLSFLILPAMEATFLNDINHERHLETNA